MRVANSLGAIEFLLKGQLRFLTDHYDVVAVSPDGDNREDVEKQQNVRIVPLNMERRISLKSDLISLFKMIQILRKEKPDAIHSITPKAGLLSMIAGLICRVPVRIHTFTGLVFPTSSGFKRNLLMFTDSLTCLCATHVHAEGRGVKNDLLKYGITKKNITIIANGNIGGVDLTYYKPNKVEHEFFTFIFCGRFVGDKGMNELAVAFKRLVEEYKDCRLLLVGKYEENLDPVEHETKEFFETSPFVEMIGWQTDTRPYFNRADVLIFPSYREGFPNVVLQANAMGLPAIVTDINGCNEIITDKFNGMVIESKNSNAIYEAMKYILDNRRSLDEMSKNSIKNIHERFDQKMVWNELLKEYNKLMS